MNLEIFTKEQLWSMIIETVRANVMYRTHKAYTRDTIIPENSTITAEELSIRLNMTLGEALVILDEIKQETNNPTG